VLALRYYNNMEYHTIASTLGLSLGNVKTLIHRGKIALAQKMLERENILRQAQDDTRRPKDDTARGGARALLLV